jgi:hypothetical protein
MKAIWFREFERLLNEGHSYDQASDMAFDAARDRLADLADRAKAERNEGLSGNPVASVRRWFPRSET